MVLLLLRNHSDAFRHRKCLIPLAPHCDYSWHGTTPGPQRSWAESRRLLLARDYSWPVTLGLGRPIPRSKLAFFNTPTFPVFSPPTYFILRFYLSFILLYLLHCIFSPLYHVQTPVTCNKPHALRDAITGRRRRRMTRGTFIMSNSNHKRQRQINKMAQCQWGTST